jgi:hypothetical protein
MSDVYPVCLAASWVPDWSRLDRHTRTTVHTIGADDVLRVLSQAIQVVGRR